jgi:hypothetical protein
VSESSSTALVRCEPALSESERVALVGFLAGYRGQPRVAYTLDPRQFTEWCVHYGRHLFDVRRIDIECFARDRVRRSPAACARSVGSTATPKKRACSRTRRRCTSADPASTTSRTWWVMTATRSGETTVGGQQNVPTGGHEPMPASGHGGVIPSPPSIGQPPRTTPADYPSAVAPTSWRLGDRGMVARDGAAHLGAERLKRRSGRAESQIRDCPRPETGMRPSAPRSAGRRGCRRPSRPLDCSNDE